jgi:hypothetical protein
MSISLKSELDIYRNKEKERKEKARLYSIKSDKKRYEGAKTTTQIRDLNTLLMEEVERLKKQLEKLQLANLYNEEGPAPLTPCDRMQGPAPLTPCDRMQSIEELENVRAELEEIKHLTGISDEQLTDFIKLLNKPKTTNDKINNCKKIITYINDNYEELPEIEGYN